MAGRVVAGVEMRDAVAVLMHRTAYRDCRLGQVPECRRSLRGGGQYPVIGKRQRCDEHRSGDQGSAKAGPGSHMQLG
jgi:hypothetical protein